MIIIITFAKAKGKDRSSCIVNRRTPVIIDATLEPLALIFYERMPQSCLFRNGRIPMRDHFCLAGGIVKSVT